LDSHHRFVAETLTMCEIYLPFYFFSIVVHTLLHLFGPEGSIRELGPPLVHQCYDQERYGARVKRYVTNFKGPVTMISKKTIMSHKLQVRNFKKPLNIIDYNSWTKTFTPLKVCHRNVLLDNKEIRKILKESKV